MGIKDAILNALTGGALNSVQAGEEAAREFKSLWLQMFQTNPPEDAVQCIRYASVAIITHANNGNRSYGAEKIESQMSEYARIVGWNREKIEFATAYLLNKCMVNGSIPSCFQWAVMPISSALL